MAEAMGTDALLRWSVDSEPSNETGNAITEILRDAGWYRRGTAFWKIRAADLNEGMTVVTTVMELLANPPGGGTLDSLVLTVDTPPEQS